MASNITNILFSLNGDIISRDTNITSEISQKKRRNARSGRASSGSSKKKRYFMRL